MTTTNSNPTINISSQNVYGNCDLKCSYNYKYNQSNSTATNNGVFISLSYDKDSTSPVVYNTHNYFVSQINIYSPSLHKFNGNFVAAEVVIEHAPEIGGDLLYVCIPIIASTNSSDASNMLSEIIQSVASNAPAANETTNLNLSKFNLNSFVPSKPFFSYAGTQGLVGQIIVFGITNAIPINQKILSSLSKIIKPYPITIAGGNVFFNSKGPNSVQLGNKSNNGIYISCQPTGSSEEETQVAYSKNPTNYNLSAILNDPNVVLILQIFVGCIVFIIVFMILNYGFNYFTNPDSSKLPAFPSLPSLPSLPTMSSLKSFYK